MKNKVKIVLWGGPEFSIPAFESLIKNGYELITISTPDKQAGRKKITISPPLKKVSKKHGLPYLQPEKLKDNQKLIDELKKFNPDLFVVASYGKIIPKEYLDIPKHGSLNIHPSLLPLYRGPTPIQTTILNGEKETGVTIMLMDEKIDHGPIIKSQSIEVKSQNYKKLHKELSELGAKLLIKIVPDWIDEKIKPKPQNHSKATFTKKFKFEDGKINWSKPAEEINRLIRALNQEPGTWTEWKNKTIKILEAKIYDAQPSHKHASIYIGVVYEENGRIFIPCSVGHIEPIRVKLEGGESMKIKDFLNGHRDFIGSVLN